jgi:hypothetical protein
MSRGAVLACLLPFLIPGAAQEMEAQSVRVSGSTSIQYVEVRPFVRDSILMDEVGGTGLLRQAPDGQVVRCMMGDAFCRGTRPADPGQHRTCRPGPGGERVGAGPGDPWICPHSGSNSVGRESGSLAQGERRDGPAGGLR